MAWPYDMLDPNDPAGADLRFLDALPPQFMEQGGFDPSLGGMVPGFGGQAPSMAPPDFGPTNEQGMPSDFWARLAQISGAQPFSFNPGHRPTGIEVLLAGLAGFGNAKAMQGARRVATVEDRNKQARENAKALAEHRWRERENQRQREAVRGNIEATQRAISGRKGEDGEPLVQVVGPDGKPMWTKRSEAAGKRAPETGLVQIEGPNGPMYVRQPTAVGQSPPAKAEPSEKLKPPTAAERGDLIYDVGLLKQLGDVRSGFRPEYVGPGIGLARGLARKGGMIRGRQEGAFRASLAGIRNQILKMRSGGAVTPGEAQRLLDELPTENDEATNFMSKLDQFEESARYIANTRRETMSSTGVDLSRLPALPTGRPAGGTVKLKAPDGSIKEVPANEAAHYKALGAVEVR